MHIHTHFGSVSGRDLNEHVPGVQVDLSMITYIRRCAYRHTHVHTCMYIHHKIEWACIGYKQHAATHIGRTVQNREQLGSRYTDRYQSVWPISVRLTVDDGRHGQHYSIPVIDDRPDRLVSDDR